MSTYLAYDNTLERLSARPNVKRRARAGDFEIDSLSLNLQLREKREVV